MDKLTKQILNEKLTTLKKEKERADSEVTRFRELVKSSEKWSSDLAYQISEITKLLKAD